MTPLFGLRLRTARLGLRLPDDDELVELAQLAEQGIHPPEFMPFRVAWTDNAGSPGFAEGFAAYHHGQREAWRPDHWWLELGVWAEGTPIGVQALHGKDFAAARTAESGSWLGQRFQGQGYGTEMRSAVLELLFTGLGGHASTSGALEGNIASTRVSEKLGYLPAGGGFVEPRGVPIREHSFRLEREQWLARERPAVEIEGLEPCLPLFGV